MGNLRDEAMVRYAYLEDWIAQFRVLGYLDVARGFETLVQWARQDSQDLPPELGRVQRALLLNRVGWVSLTRQPGRTAGAF